MQENNYQSQYQQDRVVNEIYFKNKTNGVFVDIGAHDGKSLSNTYFFEKELGWKGLCVEPLPKVFQQLKENRNCVLVEGCAWKEDTTKTFRVIEGYAEMLSGLVEKYDALHEERIKKELAAMGGEAKDIEMKCYDISKLLISNGFTDIDFLSIDVEGSELDVIKAIDFDKVKIKIILAENNYNDDSVRNFLKEKGYKLAHRLHIDDLFVLENCFEEYSKDIKFKIVIPSYNNESWVEYNLASILNQTYENYEVLYIDDASTDKTPSLVNGIVGNLNNWKIVTNEKNMKRGYNVSPHNPNIQDFMQDDEDILVFVDGDDWLYDENVLSKLADFYKIGKYWMTYGRMVCYPSTNEANPQNTHYSDNVHSNKSYRRDLWRASHLRTFKWGLYKKIKLEDMLYSKTGEYYFHAEDLATSFPCLEMCPKNKIGVLDFFSYIFNETPSNRERGIKRENEAGGDLEFEIRSKNPYEQIKGL